MAEVFADDFSSGDVSGWTAEQSDTGNDGNVTVQAGMLGGFGYECDWRDSDDYYVHKTGLSLGSVSSFLVMPRRTLNKRFKLKMRSPVFKNSSRPMSQPVTRSSHSKIWGG